MLYTLINNVKQRNTTEHCLYKKAIFYKDNVKTILFEGFKMWITLFEKMFVYNGVKQTNILI